MTALQQVVYDVDTGVAKITFTNSFDGAEYAAVLPA